MQELDKQVKEILKERIIILEDALEADCIFYYGQIFFDFDRPFRDFIELLKEDGQKNRNRLAVLLNSLGGSAEAVEKVVDIIRYYYDEVYFIVPDRAMSAGTILCMSGDKIYMDYSSSLGPIDPQVFNGKDWVPALGYLDEVEDMIKKSAEGTLTEAEFLILSGQDLALLNQFKQAKELSITLLKTWLVEYKFKDWTIHETDPKRKNKPVTDKEKVARAKKIAEDLSNNKIWHSHGRKIGIKTLRDILKLKIEDYSSNKELRDKIRNYNDFIVDYISRHHNTNSFLHSRCYF